MNTSLITLGLSLANDLRSRLRDDRDNKTAENYKELRKRSAAITDLRERVSNIAENSSEKVREGLLEAGPVLQGAHLRLSALRDSASDSLDALTDQAEDTARKTRKKAKKTSKRVQKRADAAAKKAAERLTGKKAKRRERLRKVGIGVGIAALVAAVAGIIYVLLNRRQPEPELAPPSVTDYSDSESTLVYSTTTEEAEAAAEEAEAEEAGAEEAGAEEAGAAAATEEDTEKN